MGTGGTEGSGGGAAACDGATAILQPSGEESGFVQCDDGRIYREKKVTCELTATQTCEGNEEELQCVTDADCTALPNGHCQHYTYQGPGTITGCGCYYECATDEDCEAGAACMCAGVDGASSPVCVTAGDCHSGEDCPGAECGLSIYDDGCGKSRWLYCQDGGGACLADKDCPAGEQCAKTGAAEAWECHDQTCTIGRPLFAEGSLRVAPRCAREDWAGGEMAPETAGLTAEVRGALAEHYAAMGAMEHASIGLCAVLAGAPGDGGAPPHLLLATQQAMMDRDGACAALLRAGERVFRRAGGAGGAAGDRGGAGDGSGGDRGGAGARGLRGETVAAAEALAISGMVGIGRWGR
ncbi:MAG: hypothetical protein R3F14_43135 [Polyangiaceae bacterium]